MQKSNEPLGEKKEMPDHAHFNGIQTRESKPTKWKTVISVIPGLLIIGAITILAIWLSNFIGLKLGYSKSPISSVMIALLIGMIISNSIVMPKILEKGLIFSVKKVLKLGIILLGIRLCLLDVFQLSIVSLPIIIICIGSAILFTSLLNKKLKQPKKLADLIAIGTSICGVSAIVATSSVIDASEEETAYSVAVITVFGLIATIIYPIIGFYLFQGNPIKAGLWLGTAIHDTSQVTGAALVYSEIWNEPLTLDIASVTKLVRNIFMVIVIPLIAYQYQKKTSNHPASTLENQNVTQRKFISYFPKFVLGFLLFSLIRTIGDWGIKHYNLAFWFINTSIWENAIDIVKTTATYFFIMALAGVGLRTKFSKFKGLGIKPFILGFMAALTTGLISFILVSVLGDFTII